MNTKRIVRISYFTMLTIIGGLIRIPVPFTPIAFTLQSLFVIMSGLFLGCYDGAFSQIAYMVLGLIGLPIFTQGGGLSYIFQPSFGYILSFFIASFVSGIMLRRCKTVSVFKIFLCGMAGMVVIYIIGISYQVLILTAYLGNTFIAALATVPSVLIMLIVDSILLFLLCLIYPRIMKLMRINELKVSPNGLPSYLPKQEEKGDETEEEPKEKKKDKNKKPVVPEPAVIKGMTKK